MSITFSVKILHDLKCYHPHEYTRSTNEYVFMMGELSDVDAWLFSTYTSLDLLGFK